MQDGNKYRRTKTHTLRIKDVEKSDKGSYQCLVKNDVKEEMSEKADLAVSELVIKLILLMSFPLMYISVWGAQFNLVTCLMYIYTCLQNYSWKI